MSRRPSYFREKLSADELQEAWHLLTDQDRLAGFKAIDRLDEEKYFLSLDASDQAHLLLDLPSEERLSWMRLLPPDDAADLIQQVPQDLREETLQLLDEATRHEVIALLAYAEDQAGGLMNPHYVRLRPEMSVDESILYLRRQTGEKIKGIYYAYVLDSDQHLMGVVSFRELLSAQPEKTIQDIMKKEIVSVSEDTDQEEVSRLISRYHLMAIPVLDTDKRMKGIVTVDDVVDVVREEATEDIQKIGGTVALDAPYLKTNFFSMIRKRAGWLTVLFLGEMMTATAMAYYEKEISHAVVLALFLPLIISSGGNSGSQACTLVIRAMALGEVRVRDWWRVLVRELGSGLALGFILGLIGLLRIVFWPTRLSSYGEHFLMIGWTVALTLVGIVLWGTVAGATLPLLLRKMGFDPASASAPFIATVVDITGLIIYFTTASALLSGTLL